MAVEIVVRGRVTVAQPCAVVVVNDTDEPKPSEECRLADERVEYLEADVEAAAAAMANMMHRAFTVPPAVQGKVLRRVAELLDPDAAQRQAFGQFARAHADAGGRRARAAVA